MKGGWIKVHRKIVDWEWWSDHNTTRLFMYLLLMATHEDIRHQGIVIKRGQLVTSRAKLSLATGISERSIRTSLENLKTTNEITIKSTNRFTIITICKYEDYQLIEDESDQVNDQQTAIQTTSNRPTIKQEDNNISTSTSGNARAYACEDKEQDFYFDAYNSAVWREWVQMQNNITQEKISAYLDEFHGFCQMAEKRHHSRADYQIHFVSWLKKQLAKETNQQETNQQETNKTFTHGNNRSKKCFSADEINIIVNAGLQGHNSQ